MPHDTKPGTQESHRGNPYFNEPHFNEREPLSNHKGVTEEPLTPTAEVNRAPQLLHTQAIEQIAGSNVAGPPA